MAAFSGGGRPTGPRFAAARQEGFSKRTAYHAGVPTTVGETTPPGASAAIAATRRLR